METRNGIEPITELTSIIESYFNLQVDSTDPRALPEVSQLARMHDELSSFYKRQKAKSMWLEVGAERNPEPLILARYRSYLPEGTETEYEVFYISRWDADTLISSYQGEVYEWNDYKTVLRFAEIQLSQVPEGVEVESHYDFKEYLVDRCIIEG